MVYKAGDEVSFQFRPGWFDFAEIKEMSVIIDTTTLTSVSFSVEPDETVSSKAIWITRDMGVNDKTDLYTVVCDRRSFPQLKEEDLLPGPVGDFKADGPSSIAAIIIIIVVILIAAIERIFRRDDYEKGRYAG